MLWKYAIDELFNPHPPQRDQPTNTRMPIT